jgi:hypothetical protein
MQTRHAWGVMHASAAQVNAKIGLQHLPMSITIMEEGPDFLFGLDMLRRYQCNIDLKANLLRFSVQPEVLIFGNEFPVTMHSENVAMLVLQSDLLHFSMHPKIIPAC